MESTGRRVAGQEQQVPRTLPYKEDYSGPVTEYRVFPYISVTGHPGRVLGDLNRGRPSRGNTRQRHYKVEHGFTFRIYAVVRTTVTTH